MGAAPQPECVRGAIATSYRGDARVNPQDGRLLEVTVPPLTSGRYRVYWSVIARDGHRTEGDFRFRVK